MHFIYYIDFNFNQINLKLYLPSHFYSHQINFTSIFLSPHSQIDECIMKPEDFGIWVQNIKTGIRGKEYESELMFYFQRATSVGRQLFIKRISMVCHMDKYYQVIITK